MLSILARPNLYSANKQLLEPIRLVAGKNLINRTQIQCLKTNRVFRASISAIGGTVIFFTASNIWSYERFKKLKQRQLSFFELPRNYKITNDTSLKCQVQKRWNSLQESQKVFFLIGALNLMVFGAWRLPQCYPIMMKYFTVNLMSKHTFLPMLMSTFSHQSFTHLFFNMYCLHSFSSLSTHQWGKETMLALYLSSGMFGSLGSLLLKVYRQSNVVSLGASAAVLGLISSTCILNPEGRISIIFLPFFSFTAQNALIGIIAFDLTGLMLGWRVVDHAGHLGGTAFGSLFALQGYKVFKEYNRRVTRAYHRWRTQSN